MDPYLPQRVLLRTGSLTDFRPSQELGSGYLAASSSFHQPLCGNAEGWGPLSPFRYDFTPCFIDVWVTAVSVYALVFGPFAIWWLLAKKQPLQEGASKNLHFYVKQVCRQPLIPMAANPS